MNGRDWDNLPSLIASLSPPGETFNPETYHLQKAARGLIILLDSHPSENSRLSPSELSTAAEDLRTVIGSGNARAYDITGAALAHYVEAGGPRRWDYLQAYLDGPSEMAQRTAATALHALVPEDPQRALTLFQDALQQGNAWADGPDRRFYEELRRAAPRAMQDLVLDVVGQDAATGQPRYSEQSRKAIGLHLGDLDVEPASPIATMAYYALRADPSETVRAATDEFRLDPAIFRSPGADAGTGPAPDDALRRTLDAEALQRAAEILYANEGYSVRGGGLSINGIPVWDPSMTRAELVKNMGVDYHMDAIMVGLQELTERQGVSRSPAFRRGDDAVRSLLRDDAGSDPVAAIDALMPSGSREVTQAQIDVAAGAAVHVPVLLEKGYVESVSAMYAALDHTAVPDRLTAYRGQVWREVRGSITEVARLDDDRALRLAEGVPVCAGAYMDAHKGALLTTEGTLRPEGERVLAGLQRRLVAPDVRENFSAARVVQDLCRSMAQGSGVPLQVGMTEALAPAILAMIRAKNPSVTNAGLAAFKETWTAADSASFDAFTSKQERECKTAIGAARSRAMNGTLTMSDATREAYQNVVQTATTIREQVFGGRSSHTRG